MRKVKTYIVEDQKSARDLLHDYLQMVPEVEVLGSSPSAEAAYEAIWAQQPDLLFLDVDLIKASGLDLAQKLRENNILCEIVFTTAHASYALKAINVQSLDFLVKPFSYKDIIAVVNKFVEKKKKGELISSNQPADEKSLNLKTKTGTLIILPEEIAYIQTFEKHAIVVNQKNETIEVMSTISQLEEQLVNKNFIRASRTAMINLRFLLHVDKRKLLCTLKISDETKSIEIAKNRIGFFNNIDLVAL